jgi:hypothetical protein
MLAHVVLLQFLDERDDGLIMSGFRWEFDALRVEPVATDGAEVFVVCDVKEVDVLLLSSVADSGHVETTKHLYIEWLHTRRSSHLPSSVTHLVSPGDSSMRYSSGSTKVGCGSLRTTWGSFGCAAPATKAAVHSDSNREDFMVQRCCGVVVGSLVLVGRQAG